MRYLSLFSGIEAATAAWHPLGWECVAVAEVEPFPCQVLAHHYPDVPNLGDVTKITRDDIEALGHIDVVVFGSPCQDLSVAGHRKGLLDANGDATRSGLFFTAINICHWSGARFWLWENVPGAFSSSKGRDFASVVEWMAGLDECPVPPEGWGSEGVALGTNGLLEWATLDAQWFGVAQRRRRVFALIDTGDWVNRPPILLEPEGMRGDSAPSRETGEKPTPTIAGSSNGGGENGPGRDVDSCESLVCISSGQANAEVRTDGGAPSLTCLHEAPIIAHSLRGEGFDASEDGTGRGTPLVPVTFGAQMSVPQVDFDMVQTLQAKNPMAVAFKSATEFLPQSGETGKGDAAPCVAVCIKGAAIGRKPEAGPQYGEFLEDVAYTQNCVDQHGVVTPTMQVRRLTPTECERLQGFPDGYTNIPWRKQPTAPDGPRYKALGNSMAVPVMAWIGRQIDNAANLI